MGPPLRACHSPIRAPRVVLGAAVGAGLALGVALRDPSESLADPGLIGITAGAAAGTVCNCPGAAHYE